MARGTMHAQKPDAERRRRNAPTHSEQVVTQDGIRRGPDLEGEFSPKTVAWFTVWRDSAQAQLFLATDWSRLVLLAEIVEAYNRRPSAAALSEIRMNEERLGATITDRMRARIRVESEDSDDDGHTAEVVTLRLASSADVQARLRGDK